jgi:flagellar motor switch protein FliN
MKKADADTVEGEASSARLAGTAAPLLTLNSAIFENVPVSLTAELGKGSMTVSELLALKPGSQVPLETTLDGLVELKLNGKMVARGEIVAVDDHFGVRITEIVATQN